MTESDGDALRQRERKSSELVRERERGVRRMATRGEGSGALIPSPTCLGAVAANDRSSELLATAALPRRGEAGEGGWMWAGPAASWAGVSV